MHFQLVTSDDLCLIVDSSTITRRLSATVDAFEAAHPIIGRLLISVCAITGIASVASERPLRDHLALFNEHALACKLPS